MANGTSQGSAPNPELCRFDRLFYEYLRIPRPFRIGRSMPSSTSRSELINTAGWQVQHFFLTYLLPLNHRLFPEFFYECLCFTCDARLSFLEYVAGQFAYVHAYVV